MGTMGQSEPARLYTLDEARDLVSHLRPILAAVQIEHQQMQEEIEQLHQLPPGKRQNGLALGAAKREKRILELGESIREKLNEFEQRGIEVKDIQSGIVDFPSERDGRVVYLCWRIDEETITHWHDLDAGYMGRQPLDE